MLTEKETRTRAWYIKPVEKLLYDYPILKVSVENEAELEKEGLSDWYPSLTPVYEERTSPGYQEYQSQTEKYGIKRAMKKLQLRQMNRALSILSEEEKKLIQSRYFASVPPSETALCRKMSLSRTQYHRVRHQALEKLAKALNIL